MFNREVVREMDQFFNQDRNNLLQQVLKSLKSLFRSALGEEAMMIHVGAFGSTRYPEHIEAMENIEEVENI